MGSSRLTRLTRRQFLTGAASLTLAGSLGVQRAMAQEDGIRRGGVPRVALPRVPKDIGAASDASWESSWVRSLIYDTPFRASASGAIVAGASIMASVSEDGHQVELPTRSGVVFSTGQVLDARDIASSIERAIATQTDDSAWRWSEVERVDVTGDERVRLHLRSPDATLPATLASALVPVVPEGAGIENGDFPDIPPGSGPFQPAARDGDVLRLRRNPWHWGIGLPRFDGCNVTAVEQDIERTSRLVTGQVDIVPDVPSLDIPLLEEDPRITLHGDVSRQQCAMVVQMENEPLNDVRVRRLIAALIDRESLVQAATAGTAAPSNWLFSPGHWAGPLDPDIEAPATAADVRDHLAELGLLPGWPLRLICPDISPALANASILLQEQLAAAGIALTVDLLDERGLATSIEAGDFDLLMTVLPAWIDPHEVAHPWLHSEGSRNSGRFASTRMDRLLSLARSTPATERRGALYRAIQRIVAREVPLVPLFVTPWLDGVRARIAGYDAQLPPSGRGVASGWFPRR